MSKYLLKFRRKENPTLTVSIGKKDEYKEFNELEELCRFVFESASFIKDYSIHKLEPLKKKQENSDGIICAGSGAMTINIDAPQSEGLFL